MTMNARIKWIENAAWIGETGSGHGLVIDGPEHIGGRNLGVRPMELILLGVGGCSAMDVIHILKKARQGVDDVQIEVKGERADTDPKVFTDIHLHFKVMGSNLSEKQVARAVQLSAEKYCSASIMLQASVTITHSHEIVATDSE